MSPAADPRSCTGGASYDEPITTETDSGTRMKRTLRRCSKEDNVAYHTPRSNLTSLIAFSESEVDLDLQPSLTRTSSLDTIRPLRTVRRRLDTFEIESLVPRKTTAKSHTRSPTKSPSRKSEAHTRQQPASVRAEGGKGLDIASITSRIIQNLFPSDSDCVVEVETKATKKRSKGSGRRCTTRNNHRRPWWNAMAPPRYESLEIIHI